MMQSGLDRDSGEGSITQVMLNRCTHHGLLRLTAGAPTATPTTFFSIAAFTMETAAPRLWPHSEIWAVLMPRSVRYAMQRRESMMMAACMTVEMNMSGLLRQLGILACKHCMQATALP